MIERIARNFTGRIDKIAPVEASSAIRVVLVATGAFGPIAFRQRQIRRFVR
jgi:hypothetical protein